MSNYQKSKKSLVNNLKQRAVKYNLLKSRDLT